MPFADNSELPKGVRDNLPTGAQDIWRGAFNGAYSGTCKKDDTCASKIAWYAVEKKYKKNADGKWVKKAELIDQFSFVITKASYDEHTKQMRFAATASDTAKDLYEQRMTLELFRDFIRRASSEEEPPIEFQSSFWKGGMPYMSVSHYPDMEGKAVPGMATSLYIDGDRFKVKGYLFDTPLGKACWESIRKSLNTPDLNDESKVRISIAFLDWKHAHGNMIFERKSLFDVCPACQEGKGDKVFLAGHLIHLAFTRVPVNPRTDVEVDLSMAIQTQKEDATSIVGEELAEELEKEKQSLVSEALVVKSDTEETKAVGEPEPEPTVEEAAARKDVSPADKKRAEKEYGDVTYADEKNKKYPIDTEEHIRAAWNYIHMPRNRKKYSSAEVKAIESKIVAAWKRVIGKDGPPAVQKGLIPMESMMEGEMADAPMQYFPYDGAISFEEADDYLTASNALSEFYNDWGMFQNLASNILASSDITDKVGSMKSLVEEFKSRLDQSTSNAVKEMSQFIQSLKPAPHPLDKEIEVLKSQFTEVSSNQELNRDQKLQLVQESFATLGEAIKGAIPESKVQPEVVTQSASPMDVPTLTAAFSGALSEALAPLMQSLQIQSENIRQLQQNGAGMSSVNQTRQTIPQRRSIDPSLVRTLPATGGKPNSLHEIIRRSVMPDGQ